MPEETVGIDEDISLSPDEQLNVRIAWYYYITEMTQQQIADRFNITRVRVNKALALCRESGIVQIRINSKLASCIELENRLVEQYGLREAIVVPTPEDERFIYRVLAVGAAPYLHDQLFDGCSLGVGWGRTLRHTARETRGRSFTSMTVISLMGGLNYGSGCNTVEIAASFARLFNAQSYFLPAPIYADTRESRDTILAQGSLSVVYHKARQVDLALVTVGDLTRRSLLLELGLLSPAEAKSLKAVGAVGDLLGHCLDKDGNEVDHPINSRAISLNLADLSKIKKVILVSGGVYKSEITQAVLRRKLAHVLIIDEATAQRLVN